MVPERAVSVDATAARRRTPLLTLVHLPQHCGRDCMARTTLSLPFCLSIKRPVCLSAHAGAACLADPRRLRDSAPAFRAQLYLLALNDVSERSTQRGPLSVQAIVQPSSMRMRDSLLP